MIKNNIDSALQITVVATPGGLF